MAALTNTPAGVVGSAGEPAFGAYRGAVPVVCWDALAGSFARGSLYRRMHAKAWHYASIAHEHVVCALAIIDVGIASSAFAYVFDRSAARLVADGSWTTLPGRAVVSPHPTVGASSRFAAGRTRLGIVNLAGGADVPARYRLTVDAPELRLAAELVQGADAQPTLCAIAPIEGGVANCTHKSPGFEVTGTAETGGASFDLAGGWGAFDHTAGLLARDTRWRWASASARGVALNLVEGFNGPVENVLWLGSEMVAIGLVHFDYAKEDPMRPWHIRSADGRLELTFTPEGARRQDKNLLLAKSWYVQPIGVFRGVYRGPEGARDLGALIGVTEDHRALW